MTSFNTGPFNRLPFNRGIGQEINIFTLCSASRRQVFGKVEIRYSDPFSGEGDVAVTDPGEIYPSYGACIVDGREAVPGKWFVLGDNLLDGTSLLCPLPTDTKETYTVGWWSEDLSDESAEFDPALVVSATFPARPVYILQCIGDPFLGGYPVDFVIKLYDGDDVLLHTETVTANDTWNWSLTLDAAVLDVEEIEITVTKISDALSPCRIVEIFSAYTETYDADELIGLTVLEEMDYQSGTVPVGNISSNEITVRLHNLDRRFDPSNPASPIRNMMQKHRRIKAWLGMEISEEIGVRWYPLGTFYSLDWAAPDNSLEASVMGMDRLELLRNSDFAPFVVYKNYSIGLLTETILEDAGLTEDEYTIDAGLYESEYVIPYAWFDRVTHRYALQKLAENALAMVFCDRYGRISMKRFAPPSWRVTTITRDDYFSRDHPLRWSEMVNVIEVSATPRGIIEHEEDPCSLCLEDPETCELTTDICKGRQEIYSDEEEFEIPAGESVERFYMFSKTPVYEKIWVTLTVEANPELIELDYTTYPWATRFTYTNTSVDTDVTALSVQVDGVVLEKMGGLIAEASDTDSIRENGRSTLSYPIELEFIQTRAQAQRIADDLILTYADPQRDVMLAARGHIWTRLGDRVGISNYQDDTAVDYAIIRQEIAWGGYLRASITARKIIEEEE